MRKSLLGILGALLIALSLLGVVFSVVELFDPVGSKMSDDGDPLGPPSSLAVTITNLVAYLATGFLGTVLLGWRPWRKKKDGEP